MEVYGLVPWVGAGTMSRPYDTSILFGSWVWRASLISLGLTCWDPDTGAVTTDSDHMTAMLQVLNSREMVLSANGFAIMRVDAPEYYRNVRLVDALATPLGRQLPFVAGELNDLVAQIRNERDALTDRLTTEYPAMAWADPIPAAVDVIDSCSSDVGTGKEVWDYYRQVLDPNEPTPDGPPSLYAETDSVVTVDVDRIDTIISTPDDVTDPVWRSELAYRLVTYTEAADALDRVGL